MLSKGKALWIGTRPRPPPPGHPPRAPWAPGTKTRNKQTSRGNFPLPWKQSWGGLERRVESQECQVELGQTGRGMIASLPCREHLRTLRPDVLVLHSPWCDKIPIKITVSAPCQPAWGGPPLWSSSPLMEEPQLLLRCQPSVSSSARSLSGRLPRPSRPAWPPRAQPAAPSP